MPRQPEQQKDESNNGFLWVLGGVALAAGAIWYFTRQKVKDDNNSINKMINRTLENEGAWEPEWMGNNRNDEGNYYPKKGGKYYGTNYGVTAAFVMDPSYTGPPVVLLNALSIKNLTMEECKEIWLQTVGKRMRYTDIKNDSFRDFLFDRMVQRPTTTLMFLADILGYDRKKCRKEIDSKAFSDNLINDINNANPEELFGALKTAWIDYVQNGTIYRTTKSGVLARLKRYNFESNPTETIAADQPLDV
jgi:hypothetical protein